MLVVLRVHGIATDEILYPSKRRANTARVIPILANSLQFSIQFQCDRHKTTTNRAGWFRSL
jgi:hypothetical protein